MCALKVSHKVTGSLVLGITQLALKGQVTTFRRQPSEPVTTFNCQSHIHRDGPGRSGLRRIKVCTTLNHHMLAEAVHGFEEGEAVSTRLSARHGVSGRVPIPVGQLVLDRQVGAKVSLAGKALMAEQAGVGVSSKVKYWGRLSCWAFDRDAFLEGFWVLVGCRCRRGLGCLGIELNHCGLMGDLTQVHRSDTLVAKLARLLLAMKVRQLDATSSDGCPGQSMISHEMHAHVLWSTQPSVAKDTVIVHIGQQGVISTQRRPIFRQDQLHECTTLRVGGNVLAPLCRKG